MGALQGIGGVSAESMSEISHEHRGLKPIGNFHSSKEREVCSWLV